MITLDIHQEDGTVERAELASLNGTEMVVHIEQFVGGDSQWHWPCGMTQTNPDLPDLQWHFVICACHEFKNAS